MCISIPAKVCSRQGASGVVEVNGAQRQVLMVSTDARVGDWVLVYGGAAVGVLTESEALETLALMAQLKPEASGTAPDGTD